MKLLKNIVIIVASLLVLGPKSLRSGPIPILTGPRSSSQGQLTTQLEQEQIPLGLDEDNRVYFPVITRPLVDLKELSTAGVRWGIRDDSFRTRYDWSVSWVDGYHVSNLTNEVHLYRFDASTFSSP